MAGFSFDATNVQPSTSFGPLPAGTYIAQIVDSDVKPNKSGTGRYLALQFEILDGEFKNRRVFANLTVEHQNQQAQQIGQSQLSALCRAVNVLQLTDTAQLHGRPLRIKIKVSTDPQYGDRNEVTGYEAASGFTAPTPTAKPAAGNVPPWQR